MNNRRSMIGNQGPNINANAESYEERQPIGHKKWVRYKEGAILYSMGIHSFMDLAKEAKAVYRIRRISLVNTEKLDAYIEMMYGEE